MCQHCQGIRTKEQSSTWLNPAEIKTMGFQWRGELATWEKNNSGRLWRSQVAMAGSKKGSEMVRRSNRRGHVCATGLWSFYRMTETENKDLLMQKQKREEIIGNDFGNGNYIGNVSAICWSEGPMNGSVYNGKMRVQSFITSGNKNQTKMRLSNKYSHPNERKPSPIFFGLRALAFWQITRAKNLKLESRKPVTNFWSDNTFERKWSFPLSGPNWRFVRLNRSKTLQQYWRSFSANPDTGMWKLYL